MGLDPLLRSLLTAHGPCGRETAPAAVWRAAAEPFAEVATDALGSALARVPGTGDGLTVAIMGHLDEIGLIVTHVEERGFLRFRGVGSWDPQVLVSQRVEIAARDGVVAGVIGKKPIHLSREEPATGPLEIKDLHIDIGAGDRAEAAALVDVGDMAVIAGEPWELRNGVVAARSMDNRLGCYVALEALRLVAEAGGAAGDVVAVAAVLEEVNHGGAMAAAHELRPDVAIVVDVCHETSSPDIDVRLIGEHRFGSGPVLTRAPVLHPGIVARLREAADAEGVPYTLRAADRQTFTDADAVPIVRGGIPTACVDVPLRYMHSSVEAVQLEDVERAARLLAAFCLRLELGAELSR